ncbi:DNA-binding transcriptional regulator, XRE-family HTH domain [Amphibacillus marinus]|uniref:DNA-binding transcriptional regulator, XRE-family HTH domain n=2 Tax=Amphibacillus marinus TaxID=872970 RepID=A0A1H8RKK0_9BACI|nr:DNA-binding transcriptional regulator, XRE-family HTH domain [Amphibacillus marinus]
MIQHLPINIKYYRKQASLTQQSLADNLKVSRSVVAKWESGDVLPDITALIKLSKLFNQSIDHLIGLDTYSDEVLSEVKQLYQADKHNDFELDQSVIQIIDYLIKNPTLKEQLDQIIQLPIKQQRAVIKVLHTLLTETAKL